MKITLFILAGIFICLPGYSQKIYHETNHNYQVGEEIYFEAKDISGDIYAPKIDWEFGDGYTTDVKGGMAYVHTYRFPGTYNVVLLIDSVRKDSVNITIEAGSTKIPPITHDNPLLEMNFENNLSCNISEQNEFAWKNGTGAYAKGVQGQCLDLTGGAYPSAEVFDALNGVEQFTITFWFKRNSTDATDYIDLFQIGEKSNLYLRHNGDAIYGEVITGTADTQLEAWYRGTKDKRWHQVALIYTGDSLKLYLDGYDVHCCANEEIPRCPKPVAGALSASSTFFNIGFSTLRNQVFNGYIDELKIWNRALTTNELANGLELLHAGFHSRIAQYIHVKIPSGYTSDPANIIVATIKNEKGYKTELLKKNSLEAEEIVLLKNAELPAGNYTLSVQIQNSDGTVLDEVNRHFNKNYPGYPKVGIDENNAIRVNNELYFPVTPFGLNSVVMDDWATGEYINTLYSNGFYPRVWTPDTWLDYIEYGASFNFLAIGPSIWALGNKSRNASIDSLKMYVNKTKDHDAMFAWIWKDEPELGSYKLCTPAEVVRAWTYVTHKLDQQHPVQTNLVGPYLLESDKHHDRSLSNEYFYATNKEIFGRKTFVADIYGMDYYPVEWGKPQTKEATMDKLITILKNLKQNTCGLVPYMSFVETCNIQEKDWGNGVYDPTPWHPSPEMLKMMIWINVVHGVKGLNWFPWHSGTPENNYPVMQEFVEQITELTPVVLGPEIPSEIVPVTVTGGARIETMVRVHKDTTYIFAVRVSELEEHANPQNANNYNPRGYPDPVQKAIENVTFKISQESAGNAELLYEDKRKVSITNGEFTDEFAPYEVHIYKIAQNILSNTKPQNENNPMKVYPNPTEGIITIELQNLKKLEVISVQGNTLLITKKQQLDISNLSGGNYLLKATDINGKTYTDKLLLVK